MATGGRRSRSPPPTTRRASTGAPGRSTVAELDNAMYGEIKRAQLERFGAASEIDNPRLDFAAIARDFGLQGIRVESEGALDGALDEAFAAERPVLVDVVCGDDVAILP